MIYQIKNKIYDLAVLQVTETGLLRDIRTVKKGDWAQIPQVSQPSMSIEFADSLVFSGVSRNPERWIADFYACVKCSNPLSPEEASDQIERLLWSTDSEEDWGVIRFFLEHPSFVVSPSGFTVRMSMNSEKSVEVIMEDGGNFYTASAIIHLVCDWERRATIGL